jgi:thiamine-phosphate pyrophosphorylase
MKPLSRCYLYGIIDLGYIAPNQCASFAEQMIAGGVDIIQLRAKQLPVAAIVDLARALHRITAAAAVPLMVNDHAEVARDVPIEGVHVGQDDPAVEHVRQKVGRPLIVGKSTHSLDQAGAAAAEGADYIGFGPVFATPTKPEYRPIGLGDIAQVHRDVALPIFCIGGIKIDNLAELIAAGAKRVVIVSGLLKAGDVAGYARGCKALLNPEP